MGVTTGIEWATATWNPWRGCVEHGAECLHCYARELAKRNPAVLGRWGPNEPRVMAAADTWELPARLAKVARLGGERPRIFTLSMGDIFELHTPNIKHPVIDHRGDPVLWGGHPITLDDLRVAVFQSIYKYQECDFLLLTKRPEKWKGAMTRSLYLMTSGHPDLIRAHTDWLHHDRPPANVWVGTTGGQQRGAGERISTLLGIPAPIHFLSAEPLLGPLFLTHLAAPADDLAGASHYNALTGARKDMGRPCPPLSRKLNWVIVGGESGPGARPCDPRWIRDVIADCRRAGVAVFVKQLGSNPVGLKLKDPKGGNWDEWPEDLRVRELPTTKGE